MTAVKMRENGKTWVQIGAELGLHPSLVSRMVRRWCVEVGRPSPDTVTTEHLKRQIKLMRANCEKTADIAKATNHSVGWVYWFCKKHNLPRVENHNG